MILMNFVIQTVDKEENMGAQQIERTIEFKCVPWRTRMTDKGLQAQGVHGTWTLIPAEHPFAKTAKGIVCCPECGKMFLVTPEMGEQGDRPYDRIFPAFRCECGLIAKAVLLDWGKKTLYCAAFETRDPNGKLVANKEYMHAESEEDAKKQFWAAHPQMDVWVHLVGVAPVIGFFALDKAERKLTV